MNYLPDVLTHIVYHDTLAGILPGPPMSVRGTVVTTAKANTDDLFAIKLSTPITTKIEKSNIPLLQLVLESVSLPVGDIFTQVGSILDRVQNSGSSASGGGRLPESVLCTYYLDDNLRITRNSDDNVFVYTRAE